MKLSIALALLTVVAVFVGCSMGPQRAAYTVLAGTEITADQAMQLWGAYVAEFHPPAAQEKQVEDLYQKYQVAEEEAIDATQLVIAITASKGDPAAANAQAAKASAAAAQTLTDLVRLLQRFGVKTST